MPWFNNLKLPSPKHDGRYWHVVAGTDPGGVQVNERNTNLGNPRVIVHYGFCLVIYEEPEYCCSKVQWKDHSCHEIFIFLNVCPYDRTFTRKHHDKSEVLIENTVQVSNFIKSKRQVKAWQREWNTGQNQERKHFSQLYSSLSLRLVRLLLSNNWITISN